MPCTVHAQSHFLVLIAGTLGTGTHLFVKVPQPGDNKVTFSVFESSCYLLLPG